MQRLSCLLLALCFLTRIVSSGHAELVTLAAAPQQPPDASSVSVFVDAGLLGDAADGSSISGQVTLDLLPTAVNPITAHVVAMELAVDDEVEFRLGGGGLLLPSVVVSADSGALVLELSTPGPPGELDGGSFDQFDNLIGLSGSVNASVDPEPIDLAEQDPAAVDLLDINLELERESVRLSSELMTDVVVPVAVGFLTMDVMVAVDGGLLATGAVPAAEYTWNAMDSPLNEFAFQQPELWHRGGVAGTNSLPTSIDTVVFQGSTKDPATTLDLNGMVALQAATVDGSLRLAEGTLQLNSEDADRLMTADADSRFVIAEGARLESDRPLSAAGSGTLIIDGDSTELHVVEGGVGGSGTIARLTVESDADLIASIDGLHVATDLILHGDLLLDDSLISSVGEFALVTAESIDSASLQSVQYALGEFSATSQDRFDAHLGAGLFSSVAMGAMAITMTNRQAAAGDADGNGLIDFDDFVTLSRSFGGPGNWLTGDFNSDGLVNFDDFALLSSHFGEVTAASVPEPDTKWIACLALLVGCTYRNAHKKRGL